MRLSLITMWKITILRKLSYHSDYRIIGVSHDRGFTVISLVWRPAVSVTGIITLACVLGGTPAPRGCIGQVTLAYCPQVGI